MVTNQPDQAPRVILDADACPRGAMAISKKLCEKYHWDLWTVASFNHRIEGTNHVMVGNDPQEADIKVVNLTRHGDIVVTQDIGLAALVLGKGASALSPSGKIFRRETIDFMLEERDLKARYRRAGGRTKGPAPRTEEDDRQFERALKQLMSHD
ncbi:MAG: DUF188 domain-containing protein [Bacillaceae bacterium]|nr:DUF188 domain-containing protein [Bacillaceae bacterium]